MAQSVFQAAYARFTMTVKFTSFNHSMDNPKPLSLRMRLFILVCFTLWLIGLGFLTYGILLIGTIGGFK